LSAITSTDVRPLLVGLDAVFDRDCDLPRRCLLSFPLLPRVRDHFFCCLPTPEQVRRTRCPFDLPVEILPMVRRSTPSRLRATFSVAENTFLRVAVRTSACFLCSGSPYFLDSAASASDCLMQRFELSFSVCVAVYESVFPSFSLFDDSVLL